MSKYDKSYYNWDNHCIKIEDAEIIHSNQFSWWRKLLLKHLNIKKLEKIL